MKAVFLIAVNYVREQRWPIFVLMLWILLLAFLGLIANIPRDRDNLLFVFKQVAMYVVVFSIFFGGSAIHNERKTRRILAILSKAVGRQQYLSGLVLGVTMACSVFCLSLGVTGSWTLGQFGFPIARVCFLMLCILAACALAGTVALMFSTFLNPFFGASATAILLVGLPAAAGGLVSPAWESALPVYSLTMMVMSSSFTDLGDPSWFPLGLAILETIGFWILAARIFAYVDIAVALE